MFRSIWLLAATVLAAACSFNSKLQEEVTVDDRMPMVFGTSSTAAEATETKASTPLESNFRVGVWKSFGSSKQQNVMDGYKVEYDAGGAPYKWDYTGVDGQIQRYWDLSAFPYEFRAVAPYLDGASMTPDGITINVPFRAQTLIDDAYNVTDAQAQPGVVAHVNRVKSGSEYMDTDLIKNTEINMAAKANATREVHLPFHHLNSKIGFRVFIDNPMPLFEDYTISLESIEIKAVKTGFITQSQTYSATNEQGLGTGTFSDNTTVNEFTLLSHGQYKTGENTYWNFHYHLNQATAFDLTPDYLQQIPQSGVKLHVTLHIHTYHVENVPEDFDFERNLSLDKTNLDGDQFTWEPDKRYIYYLHIPNLHGHEIVIYTCEVLPWDEVQTTDIPVEL